MTVCVPIQIYAIVTWLLSLQNVGTNSVPQTLPGACAVGMWMRLDYINHQNLHIYSIGYVAQMLCSGIFVHASSHYISLCKHIHTCWYVDERPTALLVTWGKNNNKAWHCACYIAIWLLLTHNVMPKMIETVTLIAKRTPKTTPTVYTSHLLEFCSPGENI